MASKKRIELKRRIKEISPPKEIFLKNKSKVKFCQFNFGIKIKNNLEAHYLQIISEEMHHAVENFLQGNGVYKVGNDLFKSYSKRLYLNFSFYSQLKKIEKDFGLIIDDLRHLKIEFDLGTTENIINNLMRIQESELAESEDYLWQVLEWNNYLEPDKEIKILKKLTHKKIADWWNNKSKNMDIHKVII